MAKKEIKKLKGNKKEQSKLQKLARYCVDNDVNIDELMKLLCVSFESLPNCVVDLTVQSKKLNLRVITERVTEQ